MGEIQRNNKAGGTESPKPQTRVVRTDRSALRNTEAGLSPAQSRAILSWENANRNYKREHMAVVSPDGTVNPKGEPQVRSSRNQAAFLPSRLVEDGVLVHNHPQEGTTLAGRVGVPLSGQDIYIAARYNQREVRAVTPNYVYSIKRPANGWGGNADAIRNDFNTRYREGVRAARAEANRRVNAGIITSLKDEREYTDRANVTIQTQIIKDLSKKYGFRYTRRKSS